MEGRFKFERDLRKSEILSHSTLEEHVKCKRIFRLVTPREENPHDALGAIMSASSIYAVESIGYQKRKQRVVFFGQRGYTGKRCNSDMNRFLGGFRG
jgi:hypothetical protein